MEKNKKLSETETLQKDIETIKERIDSLPAEIAKAEQQVKSIEHLKNSENHHEKMEYLMAELTLAELKNDLANANVLLTLASNRLRAKLITSTPEKPAEEIELS